MYTIVPGPELTVTHYQKIQQMLGDVPKWVYDRSWYFSREGKFLGVWR